MNSENPTLNYDEDDAVKFIQEHLPQEMNNKFSSDEINYIIDVVYDYYDSKGFLNDNNADDDSVVEIDEDDLIAYVQKAIKKDKIKPFSEKEIKLIVQGELNYCETLDIFE